MAVTTRTPQSPSPSLNKTKPLSVQSVAKKQRRRRSHASVRGNLVTFVRRIADDVTVPGLIDIEQYKDRESAKKAVNSPILIGSDASSLIDEIVHDFIASNATTLYKKLLLSNKRTTRVSHKMLEKHLETSLSPNILNGVKCDASMVIRKYETVYKKR